VRIVFAVGFVEGFLNNMQGIGVKDILMSYYEAKKNTTGFIQRVAHSGVFPEATARPSWKNRQYLGARKLALIKIAAEYRTGARACE
jgi:hypothetical protein